MCSSYSKTFIGVVVMNFTGIVCSTRTHTQKGSGEIGSTTYSDFAALKHQLAGPTKIYYQFTR